MLTVMSVVIALIEKEAGTKSRNHVINVKLNCISEYNTTFLLICPNNFTCIR